ncbi:MAG TPA: endonuclease/exonuclease/phosphatase family protein [Bryobacteraceae bacterium]|nr:endonuclease/exonuclease/phosphatase family protein [Bryobacteraceae bacterium]
MSLRLLSYNIRLGGVNREKPLSEVIRSCDPDIVILQEAVRPDVVQRLASLCGMKAWAADRGQSLAFLSRIEIAHHAWRHVRFARRRYLEVLLAGSNVRIFGVHLAAVHSNLTEWRRSYELRSLLSGIAEHQHGFHLVAGDFNTLAPGERLQLRRLPARLRAVVWMTGGTLRWTTIRLMLDAGYTDGYRMHHEDEGFTFPTWDPHVRLDYAFVPTAFAARLKRCTVVRDAPGLREASDHFPLLTEIGEDLVRKAE